MLHTANGVGVGEYFPMHRQITKYTTDKHIYHKHTNNRCATHKQQGIVCINNIYAIQTQCT